MFYTEYDGNIHLVPKIKVENASEWPLAVLPFDDLTIEDWQDFQKLIHSEMVSLFKNKRENQVTKQVVLQRLQRTLIVFLNSKWSN